MTPNYYILLVMRLSEGWVSMSMITARGREEMPVDKKGQGHHD